jgi:hypothetical protein
MKLYIALFISLFLASASATGFGINIDNLLATKASGIIGQSDLSYILQSQYNQYEVIVNAFNAGDVAPKDGKLSATEFGIAYTRLINFLLGVTVPPSFIALRLGLGDINSNGAIDLSEFTFLVLLDSRLIYNNYDLFNGNLDVLAGSVQTLSGALTGNLSDDQIFQAVFFGADYNKDSQITPAEWRSALRILGYILGINLSYTGPVLNDFFGLADVDHNGKLTPTEAYQFVFDHLGQVKGLLNLIASYNG